MIGKTDYTDGKDFPRWLWDQTYTVWLAFMLFIVGLAVWKEEYMASIVVSGVMIFGLWLCYRTYKKMQKGESS